MYVYLWQIHFDIWQNQYNIVKFKKKKNMDSMKPYIHYVFFPIHTYILTMKFNL